ncbi:MAG: TonB-dependent receptor [Deltaproteobacteria bacterium]
MKKFLFLVVRLKFQKQIITKVTICDLKFVSRTIPHSGGYNNLRFFFRFIPVILLISLVSFSPIHAASNNDDAPVTMEEVVVTATRDKQEIRKTPANVTVITAEEISKSGATTVVDVLDKLESIQFRSSSSNSAQTLIDMRGFGGDNPHGKTLVMLDGRRLNRTDMYSINWLQMPVNTIERIEIVRGSGSVLYGDAAIGGVINIITKKGKGEPKFNASVLVGSYGLNNERASVTGATDKWTYAVTGENNFSFGYRERSKYSSQGGGFDVGYSANDLLNVSLGVSFNKVVYQMPGTLTKDQMERDRRQFGNPNDDGSDKYTNVNLGFKSFWGSWGQLEVNFLYGKKDLQTNMQSWFSYNDTNADTYGITPKYILTKNIFGFDNKVVVGVDYYNEPYKKDIFNDRERTKQLSTADFTRESLGWYVRDEFSILKNLILSAGYRFEQASIKGSNVDFYTTDNNFTDQKNTYNADAYEAGLAWLFGKKSKLFTKYATVYRIPFLEEVAYFNGGGGGFLTNLDKEKGISLEAGTEFYPLENLKIGLTLFRIDMEDEIQYVGTYPTGYNQNTGKTRHDGVETSLSYLWPKQLKIYGNYTYHKATFEEGAYKKKEMPLVPQHMANAGLEIYLPFNITLRPEIQYVSEAFLSGDNDNKAEKLEAHTLLNFYVQHKPSFGKLGLTAFLGVDNIADVKYSSFGSDYGYGSSYYPMPGITFKSGISFEF